MPNTRRVTPVSATKKKTRISKLAQCIRKTSSTARLGLKQMPDNPAFDVAAPLPESAKFAAILAKIRDLDAADMAAHGTLFKHFIFTDIRESAYGVKALASNMIAAGFDFRMGLKEKFIRRGGHLVKTSGGDTVYLEKPATPNGSNGFAVLQSLPLWKNPLSVTTKKAILKAFNQRPENVHGEHLRIIVLDSKFKEGIDLFDVKYVHLVEPAIASSDLKQAVGRATRFCGQKGLPFLPRRGWPLHVFIYSATLPNRAPFLLEDAAADSVDAHELMMAKSGLDVALLNLTKELTILAIRSAVDYDLTYKINNFKIEEALLEGGEVDADGVVVELQQGGGRRIYPLKEMSADLLSRCATRKSRLFPFTVEQLRAAAKHMGLRAPASGKRELYCQHMMDSAAYFNHLMETYPYMPRVPRVPRAPKETNAFPAPHPSPVGIVKRDLADLKALSHDKFQEGVAQLYSKFKWESPVVKNGCESTALGAQGKAVTFSRTQDFVRHYLTPSSPFKGLLAWHSVGTGKTCMAVAAATTEFEKAGYTILWVTRNSLMSDVYKNIFGAVCSIPIMEAVESGKVIPEDLSKAKRMLSRAWTAPISYRTFQNALEQKNELGRMLHAKNKEDPLHKTFLIMDEVHKLQDGDLSASEAADFKTIQGFIQDSYARSGANSVRPLLMTATPISDTPNELFEILNTLIATPSDRLMDFPAFREMYADEKGVISPAGAAYFQGRAKGLVSYLNREFDPTTFSQPLFQTIHVPIKDSVPPSADDLIAKCLVAPAPAGASPAAAAAAAAAGAEGLDALLAESFVEQNCREGFEEELHAIDKEITATERTIATVGPIEKGEKEKKATVADAKKKIAELKKLFATTKRNQKERERQCLLANKEGIDLLKKAVRDTKRRKRSEFYADFKNCFKKEKEAFMAATKRSQLRAVEECFGGKKAPAAFMKESEFMAEVKTRFPAVPGEE